MLVQRSARVSDGRYLGTFVIESFSLCGHLSVSAKALFSLIMDFVTILNDSRN